MLHLYIWILIALITESFPISSSGHVFLFNAVFNAWDQVLHGPIAVVLAIFFYPRWRLLAFHPWAARFIIIKLMVLGFVAECITIIFYFLFSYVGVSWFPLPVGFLVSGLLLYSLRYLSHPACPSKPWRSREQGLSEVEVRVEGRGSTQISTRKLAQFSLTMTEIPDKLPTSLNLKNAIILGLVQSIALLPGISRFGSTFVAARWLGFRPAKAFELSFLLMWPLAVGGFFKGWLVIVHDPNFIKLLNLQTLLFMLIGSIGTYSGLWCVRFLIVRNKLWYISWYLFVIAVVSFFIVKKGSLLYGA